MNRNLGFLTSLLLILSFVLSACMDLTPAVGVPVTGGLGPRASPQEQQTKTFEALWKDFKDGYIYFETTNTDWGTLHDKYLKRIQAGLTADEFTNLIQELQTELPARSLRYESRPERVAREAAAAASAAGIGAFIAFNGDPQPHFVLLDVGQGSPAEQAGLKAHDSIFAIDGKPISVEEGIAAVSRIRGPAGSKVTLQVQSPGESQRPVEVTRGQLGITSGLTSSTIAGTNYAYLLIPPVAYSSLVQDVARELQTFSTEGKLDGLILDLRVAGSAGGWPLEDLYSMFGTGVLGEIYSRDSKQPLEIKGQALTSLQGIPVVILVGQNTTGFPEILAGGLQLHQRAIVIGETTPGAVESTTDFYLPDGSQISIESTSFRLMPGSEEIGTTGIIPDIRVNVPWDQILPGHDPVLDRAIQYLDGKK